MRKNIFIHTSFLISFFIFLSLVNDWLYFGYWWLWLGGIIGAILPGLDHLIYVFITNPLEVTSQRAGYYCKNREYKKCLSLLADTGEERAKLIFHTLIFQSIALILLFWIMTSSVSPLGKGIVLALSLHFLVDQLIEYREKGNLSRWFQEVPINLDKKQTTIFLIIGFVLFTVLGAIA